MEVAPGVHLVPGTVGNITLVCAPEVALFDSGLPGDGPAVLAHLSMLGIEPRALSVIALTHADPGHAGGAPWLRRQTGARILASSAAATAARPIRRRMTLNVGSAPASPPAAPRRGWASDPGAPRRQCGCRRVAA